MAVQFSQRSLLIVERNHHAHAETIRVLVKLRPPFLLCTLNLLVLLRAGCFLFGLDCFNGFLRFLSPLPVIIAAALRAVMTFGLLTLLAGGIRGLIGHVAAL